VLAFDTCALAGVRSARVRLRCCCRSSGVARKGTTAHRTPGANSGTEAELLIVMRAWSKSCEQSGAFARSLVGARGASAFGDLLAVGLGRYTWSDDWTAADTGAKSVASPARITCESARTSWVGSDVDGLHAAALTTNVVPRGCALPLSMHVCSGSS
jgi:hypothetical protein